MTVNRVLISGAGIAGATAAYWFAAAGWEVTVVEKAATVRSSGNPIDVRGAAAEVAQAMGVWPRLRAAATSVDRLEVVDARGRVRVAVETRRSADLDQEVEVPRANLAAALLGAARDRAEMLVGDSIASLVQDPSGIDVAFDGGAERRFDLVIGADGLHSRVRRIAFGPERSFASSFGMLVGTMHTRIAAGDPRALRLFNRPGISLSIHPGDGDPLAAFIFRSDLGDDRRDPDARKRLVRNAYAGSGWVADQAVEEWDAADDVYFDAVTRISMPSWSAGRVALLGDAADCISLLGEGSSNAIVGAKTIVDALAAHPGDHRAALAAYERVHRARVQEFQKKARRNSHWLVPATGLGIVFRNTAMRAATLARRRG